MRLRGLQWNWRVTEPCVGRHQGRVTSPLYPPVAEVRTLGEQQCLGFHEPMEVHHLLTSDHLAGGKMVLCRPAFRIWGGRRLMSKLVNLGCDALWGASNVDFPFLSTCRDDDHLLEKWTMSANFAANLLPGLTRERRVAGARWGVGRMNGRLGQYRYHRSSNRQWRRDAAAHAAGVTTEDQWYEYDGLYQVGEFQRGTLSGSYPNFSGITPVAQNQDWNYDAMGNWLGFQSGALNQTRQFNKANEITSINGPSGVVTPLYDPVGNMTSMPAVNNWTTAQTLKWDAWNRLVRVGEGSSTIAEYSYDALFRRLTKTVSGTTRRFYYSDQWQIIEEYVDSGTNPENRYWYGLREINDIARRQRYSSGTTLQDDLYALRETMNVVALVNSSGIVTQRMAYEAFGAVRFLTSAFAAGSNADGWNLLFHGHYRDADTGLYQMRFRYYHPDLGVWLSRDPIGERGGENLLCAMRNNMAKIVDALGLFPPKNGDAGAYEPNIHNQFTGYPWNADLTKWFETNTPHQVNEQKANAHSGIRKAIQEVCGKMSKSFAMIDGANAMTPVLITPFEMTQTVIGARASGSNEHPLDKPLSERTALRELGRYVYSLAPVSIARSYVTRGECYSYIAFLQIKDTPGFTSGDYKEDAIIGFIRFFGVEPLVNAPKVTIARWTISGLYCCYCPCFLKSP